MPLTRNGVVRAFHFVEGSTVEIPEGYDIRPLEIFIGKGDLIEIEQTTENLPEMPVEEINDSEMVLYPDGTVEPLKTAIKKRGRPKKNET